MKKLPFKKNELAVNKQAMTERLAAMRKAAGRNQEKRVLHMLCSGNGRRFAVVFVRENGEERLRIERYIPGDDSPKDDSADEATGLPCAAPDTEPQSFAASEFDLSGFACPHCGHRAGAVAAFFGCGCGKLVCGASLRVVNNVTYGTCHGGCGRTTRLDGVMKSYAGEQSIAQERCPAPAGPRRKNLSEPDLKRLSGPDLKRLSGPELKRLSGPDLKRLFGPGKR